MSADEEGSRDRLEIDWLRAAAGALAAVVSAVLLSAFGEKGEKDEDYVPLETLPAKSDSNATVDPAIALEQGQIVGLIEQALGRLPARQREAFLLRYWEEFDVAETAAAMGCSEGSVKTHCSRAVRALAEALLARGVKL